MRMIFSYTVGVYNILLCMTYRKTSSTGSIRTIALRPAACGRDSASMRDQACLVNLSYQTFSVHYFKYTAKHFGLLYFVPSKLVCAMSTRCNEWTDDSVTSLTG